MAEKKKVELSKEDKLALAQMAYGENVSEDDDVVKMTVQSAINRLLSGRTKEFGATIPEILKRGYYAVSKKNTPYQQAVSQKFPDIQSKARFASIQKLVDAIVGDEDFGKAQFYFTPNEIEKLSKAKKFDFKLVKPRGVVGKYQTFSY